MPINCNILLMTSDATLSRSLGQVAAGAVFELEPIRTAEFSDLALDHKVPGCFILDATTLEFDHEELLALIDRYSLYVPVIVIVAAGEINLAVKCMLRGALDIIEQPWRVEDLRIAIAKATCAPVSQASN